MLLLLPLNHKVFDDPLLEVTRSTLLIRESKQEHFGTYNCSVTNQYGTDVAAITFKPQNSFPLSVVLTAALRALVLLIMLILVIIMCQSQVQKPLPDIETNHIEKQYKESDKSSWTSDTRRGILSVIQ